MTFQAMTGSRDRWQPQAAGRHPEPLLVPKPSTDGSAKEPFRCLYAPIADELAEVERRFRNELDCEHELLRPLLRHGTQLGGKRLRPALLLLSAQMFGSIREPHLVLATVIEMVHTATLVHDDVLDDAQTRRHAPTINRRWDNHTSILLGDYLFSQGFRLAASVGSTSACEKIGEAARRVCEGELRQVLLRHDWELDLATYIDLLDAKTAELCRVACSLGAEHAGADAAQLAVIGRFGRSLGIAFQLADDYLDVWGDDACVGKTLGTDLQQGKTTLPIIRLLECTEADERLRLLEILHGPAECRLQQIRPLLDASDARDHTRQLAVHYQQQALAAMHSLPKSPAATALEGLAEFAVVRSV